MTALESLIAELTGICAALPDQRKGPHRDGDYARADIGLLAFSRFSWEVPRSCAINVYRPRDTAG